MVIEWIIEFNKTTIQATEYCLDRSSCLAETAAERFRKRLVEEEGVRNAVITSSDGRCFCLRDGYLFDLDYDPNEFLVLPLWPPEEKKA